MGRGGRLHPEDRRPSRADHRQRLRPDHRQDRAPRAVRRIPRRRGGDGPADLLLEAQRGGSVPALPRGGRSHRRAGDALQQPGHQRHRHVGGTDPAHRPRSGQRDHGQGEHRRHPAHAQAAPARRRPGALLQRLQPAGAGGLRGRRERLVQRRAEPDPDAQRPALPGGARRRPGEGPRAVLPAVAAARLHPPSGPADHHQGRPGPLRPGGGAPRLPVQALDTEGCRYLQGLLEELR